MTGFEKPPLEVVEYVIREDPEYVDHVHLSVWAEEVYEEMFG